MSRASPTRLNRRQMRRSVEDQMLKKTQLSRATVRKFVKTKMAEQELLTELSSDGSRIPRIC